MSRGLQCNIDRQQGVTVLQPIGRLDSGQIGRFEELVTEQIRGGSHRLVFDFSELTFLSSSGLRILIVAARQIKKREGALVLAGVMPHILDVMKTAAFDRLLIIKDTREEAVEIAREKVEGDEQPAPAQVRRPEAVRPPPRRQQNQEDVEAASQRRAAKAASWQPKPRQKPKRGRRGPWALIGRGLAALWALITRPTSRQRL